MHSLNLLEINKAIHRVWILPGKMKRLQEKQSCCASVSYCGIHGALYYCCFNWLIVWKWDTLKCIYIQSIQYLLDLFSDSILQLKLELFAPGCCPEQPFWVQRVTQNVSWGIRLPFAIRVTWTYSHWGSKQHELPTASRAASKARRWLYATQGFIFMTSRVCCSSVT